MVSVGKVRTGQRHCEMPMSAIHPCWLLEADIKRPIFINGMLIGSKENRRYIDIDVQSIKKLFGFTSNIYLIDQLHYLLYAIELQLK